MTKKFALSILRTTKLVRRNEAPAERGPSRNAPGFDRVGFHKEFRADVIAFFSKHLIKAAKP